MANKPGVLYYTTLGMTILYFLVGIFFVLSPQAAELFPGYKHTLIGVVLIIYGIIRIFRLRKIREATYSDRDDNT